MGLSTVAANLVLDHILGRLEWTTPSATQASLHSADPGLTGANELPTGWYGRQTITWGSGSTSGISNSGEVTFNTITGNDVTITHIGIWDTETTPRFLFSISIGSKTFTVDSTPKIGAGKLTLTPGVAYSNYITPLIAEHVTGKAAMTFDSSVFLALYLEDPEKDDSGTEVSITATDYDRQDIDFDAAANGAIENNNTTPDDITFDEAGADYVTPANPQVTHFGIKNQLLAGAGDELLVFGTFTTPQSVEVGDVVKVMDGNLDFNAI